MQEAAPAILALAVENIEKAREEARSVSSTPSSTYASTRGRGYVCPVLRRVPSSQPSTRPGEART